MILDALFGPRARTGENPANDVHEDEDSFVPNGSLNVTRDNSLTQSAVWRGIGLIANYVSKLPCKVNARDGENWAPDREHPAYKLVHRQANRRMTAQAFRKLLTKHAVWDGNGYAAIVRQSGQPIELWPLNPTQTYPIKWSSDGGDTWSEEYYTNIGGEPFRILAEDMLHIKGLSDDGIEGLATYQHGETSVGLAMEAEHFGRMFFKRGLQPSGVLMFPKRLKDEAIRNLKASFERAHSGLGKAFRMVILEEGGQIEQTNVDNEKAQFLATREFQVKDVANFLHMPPHKLGDSSKQAYASLEQENQAFLDESLDPWLVEWETECQLKLLAPGEQEGETHNVRFVRNAVVQIDMGSRFTAYNTALMGGWMSPNEVRAREELNPRPGGNAYYIPLNLGLMGEDGLVVPVSDTIITEDDLAKQPGAPQDDLGTDDDANVDEADERVLEALGASVAWAIERCVSRAVSHARAKFKRSGSAEYLQWLDGNGYREELAPPMLNTLQTTCQMAEALGHEGASAAHVATQVIFRTRRALLDIAEHTSAKELLPELDKYLAERAEQTAKGIARAVLNRSKEPTDET